MDGFKKYVGAIIGVLIGVLFVVFDVTQFVLAILIIIGFGFLGYYFQKNKEKVKEKLKYFIDKM